MLEIKTDSDKKTAALGAALAEYLLAAGKTRAFVRLDGDLGAGKTVFASGMASVLSPGSRVKSPTYTIVNEYLKGALPLYHFDFYRITDPDELYGIGFEDYLDGGICVGEWCEKIGELVPSDAVCIEILKSGESERCIRSSIDFMKDGKEQQNVDSRL